MDRKSHLKADLILLGYTDWRVHYMMDKFASAKYRLGPGHRSIAHGYHTIEFLEHEFGEYAKYIALLHALIDNNILDRDYVESLVERADVDVTMEEVRLGK